LVARQARENVFLRLLNSGLFKSVWNKTDFDANHAASLATWQRGANKDFQGHVAAGGSLLSCLIQGRRLAWLTQMIVILPVEGAERGFDRGAEAGYALANALTEERYPNPRPHENFWRPNRGGTARMQIAI
jgi:hypothetical protein